MLKGFVIGFFCFVIFLLLHIFIFHNWKIRHRFIALFNIFCSLLPIYILLYILIPIEAMIVMPADPRIALGAIIGLSKIFNFLLGILIYLLLFFSYCQFYFITDRSISVRIMIELEKSENKRLTLWQIKKIYTPDYIFLRRLKHMIDGKYIIQDGDSYRNTRRGQIVSKLFKFLKKFLQIGEGG